MAQPGTIPDYTSGGGDDDGNDPSTGDVDLGAGVGSSGEVDGSSSSSSGSGGTTGLPILNVCGQPQLIYGSPPRVPNQAGPTRLGAHPWVVRLGHRSIYTQHNLKLLYKIFIAEKSCPGKAVLYIICC